MKKQERKETANKGFSLVELIVVVAIMAVLLVVLTPQYLRYVERTRLQKDNSAIAEIANAIKIAMADEKINEATTVTAAGVLVIQTGDTAAAKVFDFSNPGSGYETLCNELKLVIGDKFTTSSNTYKKSTTALQIKISDNDGITKVSIDGWIEEANSTTTTTKEF